MFCTLIGPDTVPLSILILHLHHDASVGRSQVIAIEKVQHLLRAGTIVLGDFNSVVLPSRDVSAAHMINEHPAVLRAREDELDLISSLGLVDSFACAHAGRSTEYDLAGWTWGFPKVGRTNQTPHPLPPRMRWDYRQFQIHAPTSQWTAKDASREFWSQAPSNPSSHRHTPPSWPILTTRP